MGRQSAMGRVLPLAAVVAAAWLLAAPRTAGAWCEGRGTPGECLCRERSETAAKFSGLHAPGGQHAANPPASRLITSGNLLNAVAAAGAVHVVHVYDTDFSTNPAGQPVADPVIQVGDTVRWVFDSGVHTATSTAGSAESFDSGIKSPGDQPFEHTFTNVGTFEYYCTLHGVDLGPQGVIGMAGTVRVVVPEPRAAVVVVLAAVMLLIGRPVRARVRGTPTGRRLCPAPSTRSRS